MPDSIETGLLTKISNINVLDYTKLDFATIKAAMIQFIKDNYPSVQNDFFQSNAAVMLIDSISYINDILAFRADFLANEAYLPTASTQAGILQLLKLIDYKPRGATAALGTIKITVTNADDALLGGPGGTFIEDVIITDPRTAPLLVSATDIAGNLISFEVFLSASDHISQIILPRNIAQIGYELYATVAEGKTVKETFTLPTTVPANYSKILQYTNALQDSIVVYVNGREYTETKNFAFENGATTTYEVRYEQTDTYTIVFGDGIFGAKPPANAVVDIVYRIGGGPLGNMSIGTINMSKALISANGLNATVAIENVTATTGGAARESLEFSKFFAPRQFNTQFRAVTGQDYTVLGLGYRDGTNGSISKSITALRPYLALYGSAVGPYNIVNGINSVLKIKTKTAVKTVILTPGTTLTLQNVIDNFNTVAATLYPTEKDIEFYAFSYPSTSYRIRGGVGRDLAETITITNTNKNMRINFNGSFYDILLPLGDLTYTDIVIAINNAINIGANANWSKFIAENVFFDNKFYIELHLTSDYIPSITSRFNLEGIGSNTYTDLGFNTNINPSNQYNTSKFAVGLTYHTPDAYFELLSATNDAYTVLGLQPIRALPMAANYVDMYVLAIGPQNVPTYASESLKDALRNFINRYKILTDKVSIWNGNIKYLQVAVTVHVGKSFYLPTVKSAAEAALGTLMGGTTNTFGETFYISKVYDALDDVEGISFTDMNDLKEDGISQLTTGTKQFRNIPVTFNQMWLGSQITVTAVYVE